MITPLAQGGLEIRKEGTESCEADNGFCPDWIADNFDRYIDPFFQHVFLTVVAVTIGFGTPLRLPWGPTAALARQPDHSVTASSHDPQHAAFFLLLPVTGRGNTTALVALVAYVLLIIFRNVLAGLDNVPEETKDAGRGMGLTDRQLLWRVEVPLAMPEIMAGLRIAVTTTVGLATLAFFAGAGGLGEQIFADITFKSNVVVAGGLAVLLAAVLDGLILLTHAPSPVDQGALRDEHQLARPGAVRARSNSSQTSRESPAGGSQSAGCRAGGAHDARTSTIAVAMAMASRSASSSHLLGNIGKGEFWPSTPRFGAACPSLP